MMITPHSHTQAKATLISNPLFSSTLWGASHPLSILRHQHVMNICGSLGWVKNDTIKNCEQASLETLLRIHDHDYVKSFLSACETGTVSTKMRETYNFGTMENPIFPGLFERAAATVGGSILAAEIALSGQKVFHPAGGTHHGRPEKSNGFCYFNDPAFAILTLLDAGVGPVVYLDLDAHHGDGVEAIFANDPSVFTLSIHEENRWPHTGKLDDRAGGQARNLPVPKGFHDAELAFLMDETITPLVERIKPGAVVLTCGADALEGDPLSGMALSNNGLLKAIDQASAFAPICVTLGGGGYNPWTVVRFWTALWGQIAGLKPPKTLPPSATDLLSSMECDLVDEDEINPDWLNRLIDTPRAPQTIRESIKAIAKVVLSS